MQEELEKKTVVVITTGAKLTERLLKILIRKALAEMQRQTQNPKVYRGKQSVHQSENIGRRLYGRSAARACRQATDSRKKPHRANG